MSAPAIVLDMGKKKPVETSEPVDDGVQIAVRLVTHALLRALDNAAKRTRRSRNLMVNFILEEFLKASGDLPEKR